MSDSTSAAAERSMVWRYDGQWTQVPEPYQWDGHSDRENAIRAAGWGISHDWGPSWEPVAEMREHQHDRERWLIDFSPLGSTIYSIEVAGLPNLIELLTKLAPVATAGLLTGVAGELGNLLSIVSEDAGEEYQRRHAKSRG